jgi:magnesium-transporting ATPase (P-type)
MAHISLASSGATKESGDSLVGDDAARWHALEGAEALQRLKVESSGLSDEEAARRLDKYGRNRIRRQDADSAFTVFVRQFKNPLLYVLVGSSALAMLMGKLADGLVVLAVVVLNAVIGFVQEFRAGKAIEALSQMVPELATALRQDRKLQLNAEVLVPGDIIQLASGDRVPADARLLSLKGLQLQEAALTGESVPTDKTTERVAGDAELADRVSLVFGGTLVTAGVGTAVVVATGSSTELGRISELLSGTTEIETPLTRALAQVSKYLTIGIGAVSVVLLAVGVLRGYSIPDALLAAITLAVAAIPEGLPAIVTIALAIGVQRMAKRHAVIRKLPAVETLGSTSVICSDKTGTLTRNEMTVQALWTPELGQYRISGIGYAPEGEISEDGRPIAQLDPAVARLLSSGALCSDATLVHEDERWQLTGDPTEGALIVAALKGGLDLGALRTQLPRLDVIPFESEHQFMATLHADGDAGVVFLKGALEVVLRRCDVDEDLVLAQMDALAGEGMRVLALAERRVEADTRELTSDLVAGGFRLLGLSAMIDPPRSEAIAAIEVCHAAGITVKMITGDHQKTAEAIARQLGILKDGRGVTGAELSRMSGDALRSAARASNVFARVAPEHKLKLVRALQSDGAVVAMTGDGVNDAPALKQADIGVAMGITGTSVSKDAADVVLADDNFASIAAAVEEGRRVYDNLVKSLAFVLPTNMGLALILVAAVAFFPLAPIDGLQVPLLPMKPVQLLWINLVAAVALALPLAFEAKERDIMTRVPRGPHEPILNRFVLVRTVLVAVLMSAMAIGLFLWEYQRELVQASHEVALREAQTMTVTAVIAFQAFYLLNCRSQRDSMFVIGMFSNPMVYLGLAAITLAQAALVYIPFMQRIFGTAALDGEALLVATLAGFMISPIIGLEKMLRSRAFTRAARAGRRG